MCKTKLNVILLLLVLTITKLEAQEVLVGSGGNASGTGGTSSYSIAQVFVSSNTSADGSSIEGIQQAYEITVINSLDNFDFISLKCEVFPNPTTNFIQLRVESEKLENFKYYLYDISGNLLESDELVSTVTRINTQERPVAIYLLKVYQGNSEVKTFKIIKN